MSCKWRSVSLVLALVVGCGEAARDRTAERGANDQPAESTTKSATENDEQSDLDAGNDYKNPLIRGIGRLADETSISQEDSSVGQMLSEADSLLAEIKAENAQALRELNRQVRVGERPPNILVVVADDLGYHDLGCYGQLRIKTPHLDSLAANGARFTDFYAGATADQSSRWCMMTGYDTSRAVVDSRSSFALRPEHVTLGEVLWRASYETVFIGYWGLGADSASMPHLHGFDEWFGLLDREESENGFPEWLLSNGVRVRLLANENNQKKQYLPDVLSAEAISFIKRRPRDRSFCLFTSFTLPGSGHCPSGDETYANEDWTPPQRSHASAISRLDQEVGRLMRELREHNLTDNTVVVFLSDNGSLTDRLNSREFFAGNGPLRGGKGDLYEGGIRVPVIFHWPRQIRAGTIVSEPFAIWDLLPTLADIAGAAQRPSRIDGISMLPALRGRSASQRELLYWEVRRDGFAQAVRMGKWKVVRPAGGERLEDVELYDLLEDPGETKNVAAEFPDIVAKFIRTPS